MAALIGRNQVGWGENAPLIPRSLQFFLESDTAAGVGYSSAALLAYSFVDQPFFFLSIFHIIAKSSPLASLLLCLPHLVAFCGFLLCPGLCAMKATNLERWPIGFGVHVMTLSRPLRFKLFSLRLMGMNE